MAESLWACEQCTHENVLSASVCKKCGMEGEHWECKRQECGARNMNRGSLLCFVCRHPREEHRCLRTKTIPPLACVKVHIPSFRDIIEIDDSSDEAEEFKKKAEQKSTPLVLIEEKTPRRFSVGPNRKLQSYLDLPWDEVGKRFENDYAEPSKLTEIMTEPLLPVKEYLCTCPSCPKQWEFSALQYAVFKNNLSALKFMLEKYQEHKREVYSCLKSTDICTESVMNLAVRSGVECCILLLNFVTRQPERVVKSTGLHKRTPLHTAAAVEAPLAMFKLLLDAKADVNARDEGNWTPLHWVVDNDRAVALKPKKSLYFSDVVALLLLFKADVDAFDHCQETPLVMLARNDPQCRQVEAFSVLLSAGANTSAIAPIQLEKFQSKCQLVAVSSPASSMTSLRPPSPLALEGLSDSDTEDSEQVIASNRSKNWIGSSCKSSNGSSSKKGKRIKRKRGDSGARSQQGRKSEIAGSNEPSRVEEIHSDEDQPLANLPSLSRMNQKVAVKTPQAKVVQRPQSTKTELDAAAVARLTNLVGERISRKVEGSCRGIVQSVDFGTNLFHIDYDDDLVEMTYDEVCSCLDHPLSARQSQASVRSSHPLASSSSSSSSSSFPSSASSLLPSFRSSASSSSSFSFTSPPFSFSSSSSSSCSAAAAVAAASASCCSSSSSFFSFPSTSSSSSSSSSPYPFLSSCPPSSLNFDWLSQPDCIPLPPLPSSQPAIAASTVPKSDPRENLRGQRRAVAARNIHKGEVIGQYVGRVLRVETAVQEITQLVEACPTRDDFTKMTPKDLALYVQAIQGREALRPERFRAIDYHFNVVALQAADNGKSDEAISLVIDPYPHYGNCTMLINHFDPKITPLMINTERESTAKYWNNLSLSELKEHAAKFGVKVKSKMLRDELILEVIKSQLQARYAQNCASVQVRHQGWPHQAIVALRDISKDSELLLDYGDTFWNTRETLRAVGLGTTSARGTLLLPCFSSNKTKQSLTPDMVELKHRIQSRWRENAGRSAVDVEQRWWDTANRRFQKRDLREDFKGCLSVATEQALHTIEFGHECIPFDNPHAKYQG